MSFPRREFLKTVGLCAAGIAMTGSKTRETSPPNIFLVIADDQTWRDSGCYGHPDVHTPHIDKLAGEGMRFARCFTSTAMCAPTRQQLYTGLFPVRNGAYPNHSRVYDDTRSLVHDLKELGYRTGLVGKRHFAPLDSFPFEFLDEEKQFEGRKVRGSIAEFVQRDPGQPYFLVYASHQPHRPWKEGDPSQYDPDELTLHPGMIDTPETREALQRYYAEITYLDWEVGQCMERAESAESAQNTLFLYTSEQGMQLPFAKWTCYDLGLHTALVARWRKVIQPGSVAHAMVQYVDFLPTLVEAAGGLPREGLDGRSFLGVLLGDTDRHHDAVYGVHTNYGIHDGLPYPVRSIRTETHKYIWNLNHEGEYRNVMITQDREGFYRSWEEKAKTDPAAKRRMDQYLHRPEEELYNVREDPYELNNVAGKPEHKELVRDLRAKLEEWMKKQGDLGMETELNALSRRRSG